jgi:hypothetical protein
MEAAEEQQAPARRSRSIPFTQRRRVRWWRTQWRRLQLQSPWLQAGGAYSRHWSTTVRGWEVVETLLLPVGVSRG